MIGRLTFWLDKYSLRMADKIILDTNTMIQKFSKVYGVPKEKFFRLPLSVDTDYFKTISTTKAQKKFLVVFYGTYIPLHGIEQIIKAAALVEKKQKDIDFLIMGYGQEYEKIQKLNRHLNLKNTRFIKQVSKKKLNEYYNQADIILGIFGKTQKAQEVIANKNYEAIAVGKPHITLDTPAIREYFTHEKNIILVHNEQELATRILELQRSPNLCKKYAQKAEILYEKTLSNEKIEKQLHNMLMPLIYKPHKNET
jgi:glycosyltransferase involved in cell wall biosynthesis